MGKNDLSKTNDDIYDLLLKVAKGLKKWMAESHDGVKAQGEID